MNIISLVRELKKNHGIPVNRQIHLLQSKGFIVTGYLLRHNDHKHKGSLCRLCELVGTPKNLLIVKTLMIDIIIIIRK